MKRTSLKIRPCDIVLWLPYMCLKEDSRNRRKERLFWENNGKLIKRRRNGVLYNRFFLSLVKEDGTVSSARLGLTVSDADSKIFPKIFPFDRKCSYAPDSHIS